MTRTSAGSSGDRHATKRYMCDKAIERENLPNVRKRQEEEGVGCSIANCSDVQQHNLKLSCVRAADLDSMCATANGDERHHFEGSSIRQATERSHTLSSRTKKHERKSGGERARI